MTAFSIFLKAARKLSGQTKRACAGPDHQCSGAACAAYSMGGGDGDGAGGAMAIHGASEDAAPVGCAGCGCGCGGGEGAEACCSPCNLPRVWSSSMSIRCIRRMKQALSPAHHAHAMPGGLCAETGEHDVRCELPVIATLLAQ